nr:phage holin family protein [Massilia sp. YIM B02443]
MGGISSLFKSLFGLAVSRVELAALELSEIRNHVIELVAIFAAALLAVCFAIAYGTVTIVALAWDSMGWTILLVMFAVFALATAVLVAKGMALLRQNKLAFPATMKELKNDREMLL